jgi:hypothetical protein
MRMTVWGWLALVLVIGGAAGVRAEAVESQRLERAKDLIADEQWVRAMQELRAAADDPKETNKDEALFWLAHSQNQTRESAAALETIGRLERGFPKSRWVKPARSLGLEIAQRLGRRDVLWYTARPPAPPPQQPHAVAPPEPAHGVPEPPPARTKVTPAPPRAARPGRPMPPPHPPEVVTPQPGLLTPAPMQPGEAKPPMPAGAWVSQTYTVDTDLRIQALGSLIKTDATKVIPILRSIALESETPGEARRALFVLAQSDRPEARATVVDVARSGPEPVRIAAVRELGRLPGVGVSNQLLEVYSNANAPVKFQVVNALGERSATTALLRIAQSESDPKLRHAAIVTLGQAGGRDELNVLYARSSAEMKRPVIVGLFNARADEQLIRIAEKERDPVIRAEVLNFLQLLGTAKARAYLETVKRN